MSDGAKGIAALREEARELGRSMSTEDAQAAADYTDAMNRVRSTITGVALQVGSALAPAMTKAANLFAAAMKPVVNFVRENRQMVIIAAAVGAALVAVGTAIMGVGAMFMLVGSAIGGFISIFSAIVATIGTIGAVISSPIFLAVAAVSALGAIFVATSGIFTGVGQRIRDTFTGIFSTLSTTFGGIRDALAAGDIAAAGQIAMLGLRIAVAQGLEGLIGLFGDTAGEFIGAFIQQITGGDFAGAFETVILGMSQLWDTFAEGLGNTWSAITDFISSTWQSTIDGLSNKILEFAAQGGVVNEILKMISGVDFAAEVRREQELNRQMQAAGMNTSSDSSSGFKLDSPTMGPSIRDADAEGAIKGAAEERRKAAADNLAAMKEELDFMSQGLAARRKAMDEGKLGPPGEEDDSSLGGGGGTGPSIVSSDANALMAMMRGGGASNPTVNELRQIKQDARQRHKKEEEHWNKMEKNMGGMGLNMV
jgi:hypothetical protein